MSDDQPAHRPAGHPWAARGGRAGAPALAADIEPDSVDATRIGPDPRIIAVPAGVRGPAAPAVANPAHREDRWMFTGIVEELGTVTALVGLADAARLTVHGPLVTADAGHGDSIAVNGVCLTVVEVDRDTFTADVIRETLVRSSLRELSPGDPVNLERAATLSSRLGGHLVQGHVDGVGRILAREPGGQWDVVTVSLPAGLSRYVVEKGSITVDGVSLTVTAVGADSFSVSLIPTTLKLTTLGHKIVGDPVNLEVDVIAKYVEKLVGAR